MSRRRGAEGVLIGDESIVFPRRESRVSGPAFGVRRSAFGVRRSAFGVRRSAFGVRRSAFGVRRSAFGVRRSAFGVRRSAFGLRPPCAPPVQRGERASRLRRMVPFSQAAE
ncbi:hypothetical protein UQ47_06290 [Burkholderia pseudomallei]|nr:hypothetical protein UQ47_06290 [Burkholderia pseudomallei]